MSGEVTAIFNNIQTLCNIKRITVADLEIKAGIPEGSLSNWKQERRWMVHLNSVAKELNVTIDELFKPHFTISENENTQSPMAKVIAALEKLDLDEDNADLYIDLAEWLSNRQHQKKITGQIHPST